MSRPRRRAVTSRFAFLSLCIAGLLLGPPRPALAQTVTGTYVGNGTAGRAITGLGFRPDVVIIKGYDFDAGLTLTSTVMRTSTMAGDNTKPLVLDNALTGNLIQSLTPDGFTIGGGRQVNQSGITFFWVAFKANADLKVGTYVGDGTASHSITGLGFSPEYAIVMSGGARRAIHACSTAPAGRSYEFDQAAKYLNQITALGADGFTVNHDGAQPYVNESGVVYHYVAWNESAGKVKVGSYAGNGVDNRSISGVGFQPEYLIVKSIYNDNPIYGNTTPPPHQRMRQMAADNDTDFSRGMATDHLQAFETDGFQIGSAWTVNRTYADCNADGGLGCTYFYVAFNAVCPDCAPLATTEGAGTLTVTASNSFEMRFNQTTGAGIDQLYDLAEDPTRTYDLAGGVNDLRTLHDFEVAPSGGTYAGVNHTTDDNTAGAKVDLLEATPTRVRVRQDAFFQQDGGTNILGGLKGIGDYSVYGTGRTAVRWTETDANTPAFNYARRQVGMTAHYTAGVPLSSYTPCFEGNAACPSAGAVAGRALSRLALGRAAADWLLGVRNVANARTDFLTILSQDWVQATTVEYYSDTTVGQEVYNQVWQEAPGGGANALPSQSWNLLTYFKPTNLSAAVGPQDPAVISRSTDYRTPATPTINAEQGEPVAGRRREHRHRGRLLQRVRGGLRLQPRPGPGPRLQPRRERDHPLLALLQDPAVALGGGPADDHRGWGHEDAGHRLQGGREAGVVRCLRRFNPVALDAPDRGRAHDHARHRQRGNHGGRRDIPRRSLRRRGAGPDQQRLDHLPDLRLRQGGGGRGVLVPADLAQQRLGAARHGRVLPQCHEPVPAAEARRQLTSLHHRDERRHVGPGGGGGELRLAGRRLGPHHHAVERYVLARQSAAAVRQWCPTRPHRSHRSTTTRRCSPRITDFYLGNISGIGSATFSQGIYDEVYAYSLSALDPSQGILAHGGLAASPVEFLASPGNDATLSLDVVNGTRQGEYLYVASDSRFRGLNVVLATAGVGTVNLQWQFWNGTAWADLEAVTGFTDTTNNLKRNGNIFWTADPRELEPVLARGRARSLLRPRLRGVRLLHDEPRREPDHDRHPALPVLRRRHDERELRVRAGGGHGGEADVVLCGGGRRRR